MNKVERYESLKILLKRKKKVPFSILKEKLELDDFNLQMLIIKFLISKIEEFNFRTPHQKNTYLKRAFVYLDYKSEIVKDKEKKELIDKIKLLQKTITEKINKSKIGNGDEAILNHDLLISLKEECDYTIMLLSFDFNKNKINTEIKENNQDLYELLNYVIFKTDDINIFKSLVRCIDFKDKEINKSIVFKVLDKYLEIEDNYLKLYYKEILEEFLLNNYLEIEDLKLIKQKLKDIDLEIKEKLNFELLKERYQIKLTFPYEYKNEINILDKNDFIDLTDKKIFVIDTEGTKLSENVFTFDYTNNHYLLTLYVPAISLMVKEGSMMEKMAYEKGVTFLSSSLFPKEFLYDYCSLEKNKNRFVIGYEFYINNNFELVRVDAKKAIIKVKEELNHKDVVEILGCNDNSWLNEQLQVMAVLSKILLNPEKSRHYFEVKDLNNRLYNRTNRDDYNKLGRRIVDSLTIYANYNMAKYFLDNNLPFIFRNNDFKEDTYLIEQISKKTNNEELKHILDNLKVNSYFSISNKGHSGLKLDTYSQISTPCRNLAAYMDQKLIIDFLIDGMHLNIDENNLLKQYLQNISKHINERYKINQDFLIEASKLKKKGGLNGKKI